MQYVMVIMYCCCRRHGDSCQLIMVDFSEPCLVLRDLLCRRYGVRNPSLCGLRYEGEQQLKLVICHTDMYIYIYRVSLKA